MSPSATSQPRIAIVGGGPGGLTLGALLHKHNIPFTVFEFRPQPTAEEWAKPSGMLDLHEPDGLKAIRATGLYEKFLPLTGECSEEYVLADEMGERVVVNSGDPSETNESDRPEISRNNLAQLLLTQIPADSVRWDHKLLSASQSTPGVTELDFGNGRKHEFDLVIGADGAWSRVRTLVTPVRPQYTNTQVVTITIRHITEKYPHLANLVGSGSFSSLAHRHGVVSQRGPMDSARIYLWLTTTDEKLGATSGIASKPPTAAKAVILENDKFLGKFGPVVKELVETAMKEEESDNPGSTLDIRPLYQLPYGTSWKHKPGVTVIGDAAHVMLPNGEGVNQALLDALLLSEQVTKAYGEAGHDAVAFGEVLSPLVQQFEADMTKRAIKIGEETEFLIGMMLGPDACNVMSTFFKEHMGKKE
ncbi:hypothetical protein NLG97_g5600 [Lecanicillium saksenae]|uniref:Uncharacterized protein n=1 Tax=Lecanicillium saksenae TaxID=468837 RepID=A0ACC1QTR4_9HYPO|nr:hypothetical protein NLG97_g5600 [Lecanicillium saksenae]